MPVSKTPTTPRVSALDIDQLISSLDIQVVRLSQCLIGNGYVLDMDGRDFIGIHYILTGRGEMHIAKYGSVELSPHTLLILPPQHPLRVEVPTGKAGVAPTVAYGRDQSKVEDSINRFRAGPGEPEVVMVCGHFKASFGASINLFQELSTPIVEQFDASDRLDVHLRTAFDELLSQQIGAGAISSALLKQVIVAIVRRSLKSSSLWMERFALLGDPQIAKAFANMVARPGAPHSVDSLAETATLSRSAFMARFSATLGQSPMQALRNIRMRQAAIQLRTSDLTLDQVANNSGYENTAAFAKVFKEIFHSAPAEYRAAVASR
jgi:AraC family transcriptional activator of mtrCDE